MSNYIVTECNEFESWRQKQVDERGFIDLLVESTPIRPGDTVVELAAGSAITLRQVQEKLNNKGVFIVVDLETNIKDMINHDYPEFQTISTDVDGFSKMNIKYDVLIIRESMHHFGHKFSKRFLDFTKQLKPGGRIAIQQTYLESYPLTSHLFRKNRNEDLRLTIRSAFKENLYRLKAKYLEYNVVLDREKFTSMIRGRNISHMHDLSEEQLEEMVAKIDVSKDTVDFNHKFEMLTATPVKFSRGPVPSDFDPVCVVF